MAAKEQLHEMENQVTKGAAAAEPKAATPNYVPDNAPIEDLGGPTPTNNSPTDNSNKLKTPSAAFAQSGDVQTKGSAGTVQQDGPLGAVGLKSSGYGRGANEEAEAPEGETVAEAEVQEDETIDLSDDVKALFEGEELSESFQEKAKTIFEATIKSKIASVKESLVASQQARIDEEIGEYKSALQERVDAYLHYVASEWMEENKLAVESGIRGELSESFMTGLKGLFEEHYVSIPEEKYDVLNSMVEKLDEMEDKLNEQINKNIALNKRLAESVADVILADVSEGLAVSQKDKLASLAENVEFDGDQSYREKLVTLREAYFSSNTGVQENKSETISEETETGHQVETSTMMESYLQTLNRVSKK